MKITATFNNVLLNLSKFLTVFALIFSLFSGICRFWQKMTGPKYARECCRFPEIFEKRDSLLTKEPAQFQAEITVTANNTERAKLFVACNGATPLRFKFGTKNQLTNLQTDKNYLISFERKIYTENGRGTDRGGGDQAKFFDDLLSSTKATA